VDRLEVVNRSIVRVYLRRDTRGSPLLTFNIGSVDTFERNLEGAQNDLGINPINHIPVTYITESDLFKELLKLTPTLVILGGLLYMSRRMSAGMGSSKGVRNVVTIATISGAMH
jgi:AFG3 family protein